MIHHATRRDVLKGGAVLTVAMWLPAGGARANAADVTKAGTFVPNAFVRIGEDSTVTVLSKHVEMGQGSYTGLATIVAEELDADWNQIRVEARPLTRSFITISRSARSRARAAAPRSRIRTIS